MSYVGVLVVLGLFSFWWTVFSDPPPELGSYASYTEAVQKICYEGESGNGDPQNTPPWNAPLGASGLPEHLLSITRNLYPDIYDPQANQKYKDGISAIRWDSNELIGKLALEAQNMPLWSQIEKASILYKERMNSIYACAVLNTKLKIHTRLIQEFRPQGSNSIQWLEQASKQIASRMKEKGCRNLSESSDSGIELSLKRSLIRDTTLEYCNYRHYLAYVDYNVKNKLGDVIQAEEALRTSKKSDSNAPMDRFPNTESIASALAQVSSRAENETAKTQAVFVDAFDAYREFERNYASHILMVLIEDRYRKIREYLKETMNPIGQVIYQASNAQSSGK